MAAILVGGCGSQELEDELSVQGSGGDPPVVVEGGGEPALVTQDQVPERCDPSGEERLGTARSPTRLGREARSWRIAGPAASAFESSSGERERRRTVFGVLAVGGTGTAVPWYRMQLPLRPNGAAGYVRADRVRLFTVGTRIEVDLSERRIDFFRDGRRVLRARAAIGKGATPTPVGHYYVNQRLLASDQSGPFGPGAIGISAFSTVLTGWTQGGPIAIHGTNDPSSIGKAASYGCLRIENRLLTRMLHANPEGTPVVIRA